MTRRNHIMGQNAPEPRVTGLHLTHTSAGGHRRILHCACFCLHRPRRAAHSLMRRRSDGTLALLQPVDRVGDVTFTAGWKAIP